MNNMLRTVNTHWGKQMVSYIKTGTTGKQIKCLKYIKFTGWTVGREKGVTIWTFTGGYVASYQIMTAL